MSDVRLFRKRTAHVTPEREHVTVEQRLDDLERRVGQLEARRQVMAHEHLKRRLRRPHPC